MKSFQFRLEQALHWRRAQVNLAETAVQNAVSRVTALQKEIEDHRAEFGAEARELAVRASGPAMESWTSYSLRTDQRINRARAQLKEVECELGRCMRTLVDANQRVKLLENLKQTKLDRWNTELAREIEAFVGESFLAGCNRDDRRARSLVR